MSDIWTDDGTQYDDKGNPLPQEDQLPLESAPVEGKIAPISGKIPASMEQVINNAAIIHGVDPNLLAKFARVESSFNPNAVTGSYKGLFQLSDQEFAKHGGGDIFNAQDNANAAARKTALEMQQFKGVYGRDPTDIDLYMQHQQGVGGYAQHLKNPDAPAWQNMLATGEGRAKGAGWARQAIWGNVPDNIKRQFGSVDNITSADFVKLWENKLNGLGGVPRIVAGSTGSADPGTQRLQQRLQALKDDGPLAMQGGDAVPFIQQGEVDPESFVYGQPKDQSQMPLGDVVEQPKKKNPQDDLPLPVKTFQQFLDWWNKSGVAVDKVKDESSLYQATLGQLKRGAQFGYQGALDATGALPTNMLAGVTALGSKAAEVLGDAGRLTGGDFLPPATPSGDGTNAPMNPLADTLAGYTGSLIETSQKMHKAAKYASGVEKPVTPFEVVANATGKGVMPGNLPVSVAAVGSDIINHYGLMEKAPGVAAQLFGITPANAGDESRAQTNALLAIGAIRGVSHTMPDGKEIVLPAITEDGRALTDEQARTYWTMGARNVGVVYDKVKALMPRVALGPNNELTDEIVQTAGGPYRVSRKDLTAMGYVGAATIGMMFLPWAASKAGNAFWPRVREVAVEGGPAGLTSTVTRGDYLRAVTDDAFAPVLNDMHRNGVNPQVIDTIRNTIREQGGSASNVHIASAINGNMEHPNFHFNPSRSVVELKQNYDSPEFHNYLHLRDTLDELFQIQNDPKKVRANASDQASLGLQVGPPTLRGETVQSALQKINAAEAANPEVRELSRAWQENVDLVRRFQQRGEYGTLSAREYQKLRRERPNEVPWQGEKVTNPSDPGNRGNPFDNIQAWMQDVMYKRMSNEIRGQYVDAMEATGGTNVARVTKPEARMNDYSATGFDVRRRGLVEKWNADPLLKDVLTLDPYYLAGHVEGAFDMMRRAVQSTTTGTFAPQFAPVAALRNFVIAKHSPAPGMKPPTAFGTIVALPQQMGPAGARSIARSLYYLNQHLGNTAVDAISARLWNAYENSFYALMERGGMGHGNFMSSAADVNAPLSKWAESITPGPMKAVANAYKEFLGNWHNAAGFNYAYRNRVGKTPARLAEMQRDVTGDPFISGALMHSKNRVLSAPARADRISAALTRGVGVAAATGRHSVPWFNISLQGAKRVGQAYIDNPIGFTGRLWVYTQLPAILGYWWNKAAGSDPQGQSYSDYHMNLRNNYNSQMLQYLAIPGRPAAQGIELPIRFHETAVAARFMEIALDHLFGTNLHETGPDAMNALKSWGDIILPGNIPPFITAPMAALGQYTGGGPFGGYYTSDIKDNPFDADRAGWSRRAEMVARQLAPGIADWMGQAAAAFSHTPDEMGKIAAGRNALSQAGQRVVQKTPILRDVLDMKPPMAGSNETTDELFKKSKAIHQLLDFIKATDEENYAGGWLSTKPRSKSGGTHVDNVMEQNMPEVASGVEKGEYFPRAGLPIATPTNPLYQLFMQDVVNKFSKDATERNIATGKGSKLNPVMEPTGGIGYQTLWKDYGFYKQQVQSMRGIDAGNSVLWREKMSPDVKALLEDNKVPVDNPRAAQNFFEKKRQEYARQILFTVRAVEQEFTQRLADPNVRMGLEAQGVQLPAKITIEDLSPYKGKEAPDTWGLKEGAL